MAEDHDERPAEPDRNISSGGGIAAAFDEDEAGTRAEAVVDRLGEQYWRKTYGGQDAFECLVRTILSQNTSDKASQPAYDALLARYAPDESDDWDLDDGRPSRPADLSEALADTTQDTLAETIRSAGLYNQKSKTLIRLAEHIVAEYGGTEEFDAFVKEEAPETVRETLLDMKGVGPKTADCVLLFAGGQPGVFPVDTHVHRIARRLGLALPDADHEEVREALEATVPPQKSGFGHTAMIQFGREYCTARRPACLDGPDACPLYDLCDRVGVDDADGSVVDPSEAVEAD